jgi:hypothetical protein
VPAGPYLREFLANNGGGIADADGDRSDWIESAAPRAIPLRPRRGHHVRS